MKFLRPHKNPYKAASDGEAPDKAPRAVLQEGVRALQRLRRLSIVYLESEDESWWTVFMHFLQDCLIHSQVADDLVLLAL